MRSEPSHLRSVCRFTPPSRRPAAVAAVRLHGRPARRARSSQCGQALAECLVVLGVLAALTAAVALLGDWQWQALRAGHAGRALAFRIAAGERPLASSARRGGEVSARAWRLSGVAAYGRQEGALRRLRQEWAGPLDGVWQAAASASVATGGGAWTAGLRLGIAARPLTRHTAVLVGAGHASGDVQTQRRIAMAPTAWRDTAQRSIQAGRSVAARLRGVDRGWQRPAPRFDWLQPWHDLVPANRVQRSASRHAVPAAATKLKNLTAAGPTAFGRVRSAPQDAP